MRLSNLIAPIKGVTLHGADPDIRGITDDSRLVKSGFLFVAIPGYQQDGRAYVNAAIANGAAAVLVPEGSTIESIPTLTTRNIRLSLSAIAAQFYPRQPEMIAAVTGTSGKTSTAQFTSQLWNNLGHKAASLGTLGLITPTASTYGALTTADPITLHRILVDVAGQGINHLAMEASSHGLALHRLDHVKVKVAAFTNISREHLDFHETMEKYLDAKMLLFTRILPEGGVAVLNGDSPASDKIRPHCRARGQHIISFGKEGRDIKLLSHTPLPNGQRLHLNVMGKDYTVMLPVIGTFQIWNSLCALGTVIGSGMDVDKAVNAVENLYGVPGRLELVGTSAKGASVFVDYAHKPDALENVLSALRPHVTAHNGAKLSVVFGCGGNRDKGKRPIMGEIAQRLADLVVVTDDNPRNENPASIRRDVMAGCKPDENVQEIGDRASAIETAIAALQDHDVLVIAGKGHEKGQIVGDETLPFDDKEVAQRFLTGTI